MELSKAEKATQEIRIDVSKPIVCLTFRNESSIDTDSVFWSSSVADF